MLSEDKPTDDCMDRRQPDSSDVEPEVSIILPVYNAALWLAECLASITNQVFEKTFEVSIYNDGSTDASMAIVEQWKHNQIPVTINGHSNANPKGVGYAKNEAVRNSSGRYLCFFDADDVMKKDRMQKQYDAALRHPNAIIGCRFVRHPEGSTNRFSNWANSLSADQLYTQSYSSHGPTLIMPTWFCSRKVYDQVGGFDIAGKGTPEDLLFFLDHLKLGGQLHRVDDCLLMYRYHADATTFSVHERTIWDIRMKAIQEQVLSRWKEFTIWNAGKQGRHFYRSLTLDNQKKVAMFCDVDVKKIAKGFYTYEESTDIPKPRIPIVHFSKAKPPFIICVKQDLTGGDFEKNLSSLNLTEGEDYIHFN